MSTEPDPIEAELARWLADARAEEASLARSRERALRQLAAEEATFATLSLDLAETGVAVVARTVDGRAHRGTVVAVGADFLVVRPALDRAVFLPFDGLASLRLAPGGRGPDAAGQRPPPFEATLGDVLTGLAGDRPRVLLGVRGDPELWLGELWQVGVDVVAVRLDGARVTSAWAQLGAVTEVTLLEGA